MRTKDFSPSHSPKQPRGKGSAHDREDAPQASRSPARPSSLYGGQPVQDADPTPRPYKKNRGAAKTGDAPQGGHRGTWRKNAGSDSPHGPHGVDAGHSGYGPRRGAHAPRPSELGISEEKPVPRVIHNRQDRQDRQEGPDRPGRPQSQEEAEDRTLQPGLKPVIELLEENPTRIDTVFVRKGWKGKESTQILDLCRTAGVRFSLVDDETLRRLWPGKHQGVIARLFSAGFTDLHTILEGCTDSPLPLILALDQVQDPGNAGTLARTLYAMGGAGILLPRHNGVYLGASAAKASAGALERLPIAKVVNMGQALDTAEEAGFTIYGASSARDAAEDSKELCLDPASFSPQLPAILVLGSEEDGLRPTIAKRCQQLLRIPMLRDFDSLNVAQAGAIIISAFSFYHSKR